MARKARLDPSGKIRGVQVDGQVPYAYTFTTTPDAVAVPQHMSVPLFADAIYPLDDEDGPETVNPNVLRQGGVTVCAGAIYYDESPPAWCKYAPVAATATCAAPYAWTCDNHKIDMHGIYSWAADGAVLRIHKSPSSVTYIVTASASLVALLIVDTLESAESYGWASREVASITVAMSLLSEFNWSFIIVTAVAFSAALLKAPSPIVTSALRAALVATVAESLMDYNIDATAVALSRVIGAAAISLAAGSRGSIWALPWAIVRGVYPVIQESYTIAADRHADEWLISVVIVATAFLVGFAAADPGSWRRHYGLPELLASKTPVAGQQTPSHIF